METLNNNSEKVTSLLNELLNTKIYTVRIGADLWSDAKLITTNLKEAKKEFEGMNYSDFDDERDNNRYSALEVAEVDAEKIQDLFNEHVAEIDVESIESDEEYESELIDILENIKYEIGYSSTDFIDYSAKIDILDEKKIGFINSSSYELLDVVEDKLGADLEDDNFHGYKIIHSGSGKYSDLIIENAEGEEIKTIKLRISDHTYNPENNSRDEEFISVEIANKNATIDKFHTKYSLRFNSDNNYSEILSAVLARLEEIVLDIE